MDYAPLILLKQRRLAELEDAIASPEFYSDPARAGLLTREHAQIKRLMTAWQRQRDVTRQLAENRTLAAGTDELAEMAREELPLLEAEAKQLDTEVQYALLPRDATEDRDAILEIRAGTGGGEASLFAAELLRMYTRFAERRGWKVEVLEASTSEVGGLREAIAKVSGEEVFRWLKYESGVHRVQRVPVTEAQGRIHTSTATVAVLPEAQEVDLQLRQDELRIEVCRASGPGGQGVNTTDSAVQVMHIPTGMIVKCMDGRSQQKNKEKALTILRSRLLEQRQREEAEKYSAHRRNLIGSGGREEKIRTHNFPQNRVTDHRINLTIYNLPGFMDGDINEMISSLQASEMEDRIAELQKFV